MHKFKLDLLRKEFPDFIKPRVIYAWPRVLTEYEWEETSWHNDMTPSWVFHSKAGIDIKLFTDHCSPEDRESPSLKRYSVALFRDGEYLLHAEEGCTDDMDKVSRVIRQLIRGLS